MLKEEVNEEDEDELFEDDAVEVVFSDEEGGDNSLLFEFSEGFC